MSCPALPIEQHRKKRTTSQREFTKEHAMRLNRYLLLIFILFVTCCIMLGCERGTIQNIIIDDTCHPDQDLLSCNGVVDPGPLETAQYIMKSINGKRTRAHEDAKAAGDFTTLPEVSEEIFEEELGYFGYEKGFSMELITIWEQTFRARYQVGEIDDTTIERYNTFYNTYQEKIETEHGEPYFEFIRAYDNIIAEYARIAFAFESSGISHNELIEHFRESMARGNTDIIYPEGF